LRADLAALFLQPISPDSDPCGAFLVTVLFGLAQVFIELFENHPEHSIPALLGGAGIGVDYASV
jgi:hypothetical protein